MIDAPPFPEEPEHQETWTTPDALTIPEVQTPPVAVTPPIEEDEGWYVRADEPDQIASSFVSPFQLSHAMPTVSVDAQSAGQNLPGAPANASSPPPVAPKRRRLSLPLPLLAILICVIVIIGMVAMTAFAQTTPPLHAVMPTPGGVLHTPVPPPTAHPGGPPPTPASKGTPTPMPQATAAPQSPGQGGPPAAEWVPEQLPAGWTDAGLTMSDALEAERSAFSFTDREMSLDYRNVGTRAHHGGTMTAGLFLLTPAAQQRFLHNDVRMMNNVLFDQVQQTKLIREVIDASPHLLTFAVQGRQQFAWVDVSFQLWISQTNPPMEGKAIDPGTGQPRVQHLVVLLVRIPPATQGPTAPMGGTGWLVSNYQLDPAPGTLPAIVAPA